MDNPLVKVSMDIPLENIVTPLHHFSQKQKAPSPTHIFDGYFPSVTSDGISSTGSPLEIINGIPSQVFFNVDFFR